MDHMKRLMVVFICYLLVLLNNTKINSFKFDLAFYLDSVNTSLGATAVDREKKQVADEHEKSLENALTKYSKSTFLLNVDDYHRFTSRDNVMLPVYQAQNQYPLITKTLLLLGNHLQIFFAITYIVITLTIYTNLNNCSVLMLSQSLSTKVPI
jgi:hypothetical protein